MFYKFLISIFLVLFVAACATKPERRKLTHQDQDHLVHQTALSEGNINRNSW